MGSEVQNFISLNGSRQTLQMKFEGYSSETKMILLYILKCIYTNFNLLPLIGHSPCHSALHVSYLFAPFSLASTLPPQGK